MRPDRILLGMIVGSVVTIALDALFYGYLMHGKFTLNPACDLETPNWTWMIIGVLILMGTFTYLFDYLHEPASTPKNRYIKGARFGSAVGVLIGFGFGLIIYSIRSGYPIEDFVIDGIYDTGKFAVVGVIIATILKGGSGGDRDDDSLTGTGTTGTGTNTGDE